MKRNPPSSQPRGFSWLFINYCSLTGHFPREAIRFAAHGNPSRIWNSSRHRKFRDLQARQSAAIGSDTRLHIFRTGEILPPARTNEQEVELIRAEPKPQMNTDPHSLPSVQ